MRSIAISNWLAGPILASALLSCALCIPAAAQDTILRKVGSVLPGPGDPPIQVVREACTGIEYRIEGREALLTIPVEAVADIQYDRVPDAYRAGLQSLREKQFDQAIDDFREAIKRGKGYHWVEQNALFRIGRCHAFMGMHQWSVRVYRTLLRRVPRTRFFFDAWLGIIQGSYHDRNSGDENMVLAAIEGFELALKKNQLEGTWSLHAAYWRLRLRGDRGEDITREAGDLLARTKGTCPRLADRIRLLVGNTLFNKDPDRAETNFRAVLRSAGKNSHGAKAGACVGLGLCLLRSTGKDDATSVRKALLFFLRAVILGDRYPHRVEIDVKKRALFQAGRCFVRLLQENRKYRQFARDLIREFIRIR